jgi:hypothetical protein
VAVLTGSAGLLPGLLLLLGRSLLLLKMMLAPLLLALVEPRAGPS